MPRKAGRKNRKGRGKGTGAGGGKQRQKKDGQNQNPESVASPKPGENSSVAVAGANEGAVAEAAQKAAVVGQPKEEGKISIAKTDVSGVVAGVAEQQQPLLQKDGSVASKQSVEKEDSPAKGYLPHLLDRLMRLMQIDITSGVDDGKYVKDGKITEECITETYKAFFKDFENMDKAGLVGKRTDEEERAAELHEEVLFSGHYQQDDCPVCFLPLPVAATQKTYKVCCGKVRL